MSVGIVAVKCGMTRQFKEDGSSVPVTVVLASPNRIMQIKTSSFRENGKADGYDAIQVSYGKKKVSRVNKPTLGHCRKASAEPGLGLYEFRLPLKKIEECTANGANELTVDQFHSGQIVDVTGISKGKGFAGVIKRHNFAMQDATHGNSLSHRAHGSTGQRQSPGRVFKNKKMAGRMGGEKCTVQNISIVSVDQEKNLMTLCGGLPGAPGSVLVIKPAIKAVKLKV
jgi:large subunit ribosomal protein L3